jgi:long-chain fatty acid transport protein
MKKLTRLLASCGVIGVALASSSLYAAGYKLEFQSASTLADAGEAAAINDAGINWYNSAGTVYLPQQIVYSAIDVYAPTTFTGSVTGGSPIGPAFNFQGQGSASAHSNSVLPAFHFTRPVGDRYAFAISVVPAWGFMENYGEGSIVRYDLTRVYTKTIDIAPSFAWKINSQWSVGAGPDINYFSVQSKSHVYTQPLTPVDSSARFSANAWGYGGHVGIMFTPNEGTHIGLNYRSQIVMPLDGYSDFVLGEGARFESAAFKLGIPLPPVTTLSAYHEFTPRVALMGTLSYEQWGVLENYHAQNYRTPAGVVPNVVQQQNMSNTLDISAGAHYKWDENWLLRGSLRYLPTPTNNAFRDVNFPDGKKLGINIGTRYQVNKKLAVDLIYGHVFVQKTRIHGVYPQELYPNTVATNGHATTSIDLFGGQVVYNI